MLSDILSDSCNLKPGDIYIPHKAIVCVFKHNSDKIKRWLDDPPKPVRTKTGKISKKKPEKLTPSTETFNSIGNFARRINYGLKPDMNFYDCSICVSESVCIYRANMMEFQSVLKKQLVEEKHAEYKRKHHGQGNLFPELLR